MGVALEVDVNVTLWNVCDLHTAYYIHGDEALVVSALSRYARKFGLNFEWAVPRLTTRVASLATVTCG